MCGARRHISPTMETLILDWKLFQGELGVMLSASHMHTNTHAHMHTDTYISTESHTRVHAEAKTEADRGKFCSSHWEGSLGA